MQAFSVTGNQLEQPGDIRGQGRDLWGESQRFPKHVTNQKETRRILFSKDPEDPSVGLSVNVSSSSDPGQLYLELRMEVGGLGSDWLRAS